MISIDRFEEILSDLAEEIPQSFYEELNGGIVVWDQGKPVAEVPLAIAGIMSDESLTSVNEKLEFAKAKAHELGVNPGIDPFMTLSFMALPVIPSLRITTRGVFDVTTQSYV